MTGPEARQLARTIHRMQREIRGQARASQAALRSVEVTDGAVTYYDEDGEPRLTIGPTEDGAFTIVETSPNLPPTPTPLTVEPVPGGVVLSHDGTFEDATPPTDFAYFEVHAGDAAGFEATDYTQIATFPSLNGGSYFYALDALVGTRYFAIQAVNRSGGESDKSTEVPGEGLPFPAPEPTTDGLPPASSPAARVTPLGIGGLLIEWDLIANPEPVTYDIYFGAVNPPVDLIGTVAGTALAAAQLLDGTPLVAGTPYYAHVVAKDVDGAAAPGAVGTGTPRLVTRDTLDQEVKDDITLAQAAANGKNRIWYAPEAPVAPPETPHQIDDIWFDTDDGNQPNRWDGDSWEPVPFGNAAIGNLDAAKITAGFLDVANRIEAGSIDVDKIGADLIAVNEAYAKNAYLGQVEASQITAGDLFAALALLGSLTVGSEAGRRLILDPDNGLRVIDQDGNPIVQLPTDPGAPNMFSGDIAAQGLSISGKAELKGILNEISTASYLTLQSGVTPPANTVVINPKATTTAKASGYSYYAATAEMLGTVLVGRVYDFQYGKLSDGTVRTVTASYTAGSGRATAYNIKRGNSGSYNGFNGPMCTVRIGASIYGMFWKYDEYNWLDYMHDGDPAALPLKKDNHVQLWVGKWDAATGAMQSQWRWDATYNTQTWGTFQYLPAGWSDDTINATPAMATDGTYLYIAQTRADLKVQIQKFSTAGVLQSTITTDAAIAPNAGAKIASLGVGNFDYGSQRFALSFWGDYYSGQNAVYSIDAATGVVVPGEQWSAPYAGSIISWDGTRFIAHRAASPSQYMSTYKGSGTVWAAFTWYDSDPAGTGTHETTIGPASSSTRSPRYGVSFTVFSTPVDGGMADDPDLMRIYAVEGASPNNMRLQGAASVNTRTITVLDNLDGAGALVPAANTFPDGLAATLQSALGGFVVRGDGSGQWPQLTNPLSTRITSIEALFPGTRLTSLEDRATSLEARAASLEARVTALEAALPYANRWQAVAQSVASGVFTNILLDSVDNSHSTITWSSITREFTLINGGLYLLSASLVFNGTINAAMHLRFTKNGAAINQLSKQTTTGASDNALATAGVFRFAAGDTVAMQGRQASGANRDTFADPGRTVMMSITRIGG